VVKAGGVVDFGGTNTTAQGNAGTLIVDATLSKAVTVTGTSGVDSITGGSGADVITAGVGVDTLDGGAGNDTFNYVLTTDLFASNAIVDSVVGGDGVDTIQIGAATGGFTIANSVVWSRASDVEVIKSVTDSGAVSVTLGASAAVAGITKVDLSLGTSATGNVIDVSAYTASTDTTLVGSSTGNTDITGGDGIDKIIAAAGGGSINGGLGLDIITLGAGIDNVQMKQTSDADADTVVGFTTADFLLLGASGATVATAVTAAQAYRSANLVLDTAANLGDLGSKIVAVNAAIKYAIASDTGAIYYDADGNWSTGSVKIGSIGAGTGITHADVLVSTVAAAGTIDATGLTATEIAALVTDAANVAAGGIKGTVSLTSAQVIASGVAAALGTTGSTVTVSDTGANINTNLAALITAKLAIDLIDASDSTPIVLAVADAKAITNTKLAGTGDVINVTDSVTNLKGADFTTAGVGAFTNVDSVIINNAGAGAVAAADLKTINDATTIPLSIANAVAITGSFADTLAGLAGVTGATATAVLTGVGSTTDTATILTATTGAVTTGALTAGTYTGFATGDKIATGLTFTAHTSTPSAGDSNLTWAFSAGTLTYESVDAGTATNVALVLTGVTAVSETGGTFTLTV
jgi:hypothetical protein